MTYRKKLIEVALPLDAINREAAREKSIRHGHPSTLHLWWARRPLAACRAVLFSSLVDDPDSDPAYAGMAAETREHAAGEKRQQLFRLIEELVKWENSNNDTIINAARAEIARCVASRKLELGELKKTDQFPGGETVWDLVVKGHGDLDAIRAGKWRLPPAEAVNAFLAEQEGEYDADTRWCIKWFEQYAHNDGPYGDAETLCKAMAVGVNGLVETGVVAAKSGKVRLFKRADLMGGKPETWDPAKDMDICHWEVAQYLIHALDSGGESAAADLLRRVNARYAGAAEVARDLAYRLYSTCERKKWAEEARSYNGLVVAWPEIRKLAMAAPAGPKPTQAELF